MLNDVLDRKNLEGFMLNVINNTEKLNMRDSAFACCYLLKTGKTKPVKNFIESAADKIEFTANNCMDLAFWLWSVSGYVNTLKKYNTAEINVQAVRLAIDCIETGWDKEYGHWLENSISGVFTSNIAVMYAAIDGINKLLNDSDLELFLEKLRTFTFLEDIREGEYVGKRGCLEVLADMGDISTIAVPFGLVELDDLFLHKSVNSIERNLMAGGVYFSKRNYPGDGRARIDLTCLLSWYYSEAGYPGYSELLLEQAQMLSMQFESCKELDCILYAIASHNLNKIKQVKDKSLIKEVKIIHKPAGENDPYISRNYERYPRYPEENDNVYLSVNTQLFSPEQEVFVKYSVNGKMQTKLLMSMEKAQNKGKYWKACIGKFNFSDKVDYSFEVQFKGKKTLSQQFSFSVRKWHTLEEIEYADYSNGEVKLLFKPVGNLKGMPCLHISEDGEDTLKFSFSVEQREKAYHIINIEEKANIKIFLSKLGQQKFEFDGEDMYFKVSGSDEQPLLESYRSGHIKLLDVLLDGDNTVRKVKLNLALQEGERIFGMGERFSGIEYRGLEVDCCVYDKYTDHGLKTYLPVPFFTSSMGYGIFFDTSTFLTCRFGSTLPDLMDIEVDLDSKKQSTDFYIFTGKPKDILRSYTRLTGTPMLPPKWCFGLWMSSNSWNSQNDIIEQTNIAQKYGIPVSTIILEQWSDEATFYIFNGAEYEVKSGDYNFEYEDFKFTEGSRWPNPKMLVDFLHSSGIKVLLWQDPYHTYLGSAVNKQRDADEKTMLENNYHVRYKDGKAYRSHFYWFGHCLIPDFTNPEAKKWWLNKRQYLIKDIGIDGFKIDGGECILDEGLFFYNSKTEEEMRNEFPNEFIKGYSEFLKENTGDAIVFSRAGTKGAQTFSLHWAGDDVSTFKAFREAVNAGLSSGMSGISNWGWDFGGFCSEIPTTELYIRSTEMSVFCPIMQFHSESMEKQKYDRTPWNIAERTDSPYVLDIFKKYMDLRMNLLPYIYQQAVISSRTGIPMMRTMFIEFPDDNECITMAQQYMFGESMLVAPVLDEGATSKEVYLPKGKWLELFTGDIVNGGRFIKTGTEIDRIPVYIKENSIIPLNLSNEYKLFSDVGNKLDKYKNLCFLLYVTKYAKYEFCDDLGNLMNFEAQITGNIAKISTTSNYTSSIAIILKNSADLENVEFNGDWEVKRLNPETFIIDPKS